MITFTPHPDIAPCKSAFDAERHKTYYRYDYAKFIRDWREGNKSDAEIRNLVRFFCKNDLFFIVCFVMQIEKANHPFVVQRCHDVQDGPATDTLDIWARGHFKSTVITQAETLQFHLRNPEKCTGIMAYSRPAAKKFLRGIKILCENSRLLVWAFPDVLWEKPVSDAPKWSEDDGICFKRQSASRGESTIEAWGLTEGMPTGRHFERLVFDDLETEDIRDSPDMLEKVYSNFQMAAINLATQSDTDVIRVIGTYYSHFGPNVRIRDLKFGETGEPIYHLRVHPGSDDGTRNGTPVYMDTKAWEKAKESPHFSSQQLCDPTPSTDIKLPFTMLKPINPKMIPHDCFKFMVLDQAGDAATQNKTGKGDKWAFGVFAVQPQMDELGASNVYMVDVQAGQMRLDEAINNIVQMYLRNGMIMQLGVEKVGLSTTEVHICDALRAKGRFVSVDNGNLKLLKPAGRSLELRIESNLQWPLTNGKLFYSEDIPITYMEMIRDEMDKFPFFHADVINMWAYLYDMLKDYRFPVGGVSQQPLKLVHCNYA